MGRVLWVLRVLLRVLLLEERRQWQGQGILLIEVGEAKGRQLG